MVLDILKQITKLKDFSSPKHGDKPYLNQAFLPFGGRSGSYTQSTWSGFNVRKFWQWFRTRPELYSVISIPVNDIIGGPVEFLDKEGSVLGRNKRLLAQKFWDDNQMKEVMKSIEFDSFLTGDGYGWIGKLPKTTIKELANNMVKTTYSGLNKEEKAKLSYKLYESVSEDEDIVGVKSYMQIPSSTVSIVSDQYNILYYLQRIGGTEQRFNPDEVIHFVLERLDGKVNGFSPVQAMTAEMFLLQMIKDNMIGFFENGGHPSKIYSLPDVKTMTDPAYKRLVEMLQESKTVINSNGSLIYPGKLEINDLGALPKDMEYKDLAMWVVSILAFAFEIPTSRMPYLISGSGGAVNSGGSSGLGDAGYWKRVENRQDYLEDVYNKFLFSKIGFYIRFPRGNKQDKIRETQMLVQRFDGIGKVQEILMKNKKQLSEDALLRMLNGDFIVSSEDLSDISPEDIFSQQANPARGTNRQNQLNNMQSLREEDTVDRSNAKRDTANNNGISS